MPRKDLNQTAFDIVQQATGETVVPADTERQINGRKGGMKGGTARANALSEEERSRIAKLAAAARWKQK